MGAGTSNSPARRPGLLVSRRAHSGWAPGRVTRPLAVRACSLRFADACYVARVAVHTSEIRLSTRGHSDIVDITRRVQAAVTESGTSDGQASAFVRGSTAAVTTM